MVAFSLLLGLFCKKDLQIHEWKYSSNGILLLILKSFFASGETLLKKAFAKKVKIVVLFKKKSVGLCLETLMIRKCTYDQWTVFRTVFLYKT